MTDTYTHFDLLSQMPEVPTNGILSQTLHNNACIKTVLFGFAPGQELSEHTASMPAILHILKGEAVLVLNGEMLDARAGTWAYMPARLPHSVLARTEVVLLLELLKTPECTEPASPS
jgi:quercetin dioxygenase-like cupin family protein